MAPSFCFTRSEFRRRPEPERRRRLPRDALAGIGFGIESQRFDPQALRIDDLEDDRIGLRDLAGHGVGRGDDSIDRRDQRLRLALDFLDVGAAFAHALQREAGLVQRRLRRGLGLDQDFITGDPPLGDGDLLVAASS
ncbi:hypothetical protein QM467_05345 [Rhodoblastus sp. 17X3]|uniref:hypothetical protein n=1 Tax=Rhodoblastus sp. 17X3 TaxID=3047026 RepID=UPI0024B6ADFD|nr:hypothetical protein [Rhodoblastus sp. 17X3]MDI9847484.1 hypothetical protein [Rhodoblastus sp. 17X3]